MAHDPAIDELRAEIAQLRSRLQANVAPGATTRRRLLRLAGAAAVGAAASAVARPNTSAAGGNLVTESVSNAAGLPTGLQVNGTSALYGFGVTDNGLGAVTPDIYGRPALLGHAKNTTFNVGVAGFNEARVGIGVVGASQAPDGVGVLARSEVGVGMVILSRFGALQLITLNTSAPPERTVSQQSAGTIDVDNDGNLWHCVDGGQPGTWRKLSGPATAGAFHAIDPVRVYDSRLAAPTPGQLATNANRVVSVADGRNPTNGAVTTVDAVPVGAMAIAYNLTITETIGSGFLSVAPGNATTSPSSSINWSTTGQTLANGLIGRIHTDRTIKVFCGGGGTTHFIIDVTGYWR